jgi:glycosyltransferase involved in cell wall biosynthesis
VVTIILTVFNKQKWLNGVLAAIANQTYKKWKVIAIDDASTDQSLSILKSWGKTEIISLSTNQGPVIARNIGLSKVDTKYVLFLDADDLLYPTFLEETVTKMEEEKLDMCFSLYERHSDDGITVWGIPEMVCYDKGNYIAPSFTLLRASVFKEVGGFCNAVRGVEDWDLWCRIVNAGFKVGCLPKRLGRYNITLNGEASKGSFKHALVFQRQKTAYRPLRNKVGIVGVKEHIECGVPFLLGFCLMMKKSMLDEIGLLDERFKVGSMEDVDICFRAKLAGYETRKKEINIQHIPEATVHHLPQGRQFWEDRYHKNQALLVEKWNLKRRVTVDICTRNRFSSLGQVLQAVLMQTYKVDEIIINDDADPQGRPELHKDPNLALWLAMALNRGIQWHILYGDASGQVAGHKRALKFSSSEYIWRLDDDNIPEPRCLEILMSRMRPDIGAVGGVVIEPNKVITSSVASNKIEDIYVGLNQQWFASKTGGEVDHLYSTFLYRKTEDFYPDNLSRIGHREETIMTHRMKRAGWKLYFEPAAITWHMRIPTGGIRDGRMEMFNHDEQIFAGLLRDWGVKPNSYKIVTLDNGLGDHYAFKTVLPSLLLKYPKMIIACCYPQVFDGFDVRLCSIGEAKMAGWGDNIYGFMNQNHWKGSLTEAYEAYYS